MAVDVAELAIRVSSGQVTTASNRLSTLVGRGKSAENQFQSFGRTAQRLGGFLTAFVTGPLVGASSVAIKTASEYEQLRVQLDNLTGSAEQGAETFDRLVEFSAGTPFRLEGIVRANNQLIGMGMNAEEAFESLQLLGNISSATGAELQDIARVFGESRAEGKLLTRDIRQFTSQGVPAVQLLADSLNVAQGEIFDLAEQGEISFEKLRQAFQEVAGEGGQWASATEDQANTIAGLWSTLRDNVDRALGDVGSSLADTFNIRDLIRELTGQIQQGIDWFNSLSDETRRAAFMMAGLLGASGPIIAALGTLSLAIGAISAPVAATVAAVAVGAAAIIDHWEEVESYFTTGGGARMWETIQRVVKSTVDGASRLWELFGDNIIQTTESAFTIVTETVRATLNGLSIILDIFTGRWITDWRGFLEDTEDSLNEIYGRDGSARIILEEFLIWAQTDWVFRAGHALGTGLGNMIISALNSLDLTEEDIPLIKDLDELIANSVSASRAERALRRAKQRLMEQLEAGEDIIIPAEIDLQTQGLGTGEFIPVESMVPVKLPVDIVLDDLPSLRDLTRGLDLDLGDKMLPPDSLGALRERLRELRRQMEYATDPATVSAFREEIRNTESEIDNLTNTTGEWGQVIQGLRAPMESFLSSSLSEMMTFKEETRLVRNEFGELEEQTVTLADRMGQMFQQLLDQIMQTVTQLLIIRPLMNSLFGENIGSGSVGGVLGDLFGGGKAHGGQVQGGKLYAVGERGPELFAPGRSGTIISNDNIGSNVTVNINNQTGAQVDVTRRQTPRGVQIDALIRNTVKDGMERGAFDGTMSRNFGITRRGRT